MGYAILAILIVTTAAGLWWAGRLRGPALQIALAALMVGGAGYALQGRPGLPGVAREGSTGRPALPLTEPRQAMLGTFTAAERFLLISDSFARRGNLKEALGSVRAGLKAYPDNLALRIGYANALVDYAGSVTPAARLAFEQARAAAPNHAAPYFFEGLALARAGDREGGLALLQQALARTPQGASYRRMIEEGAQVLSLTREPSPRP